MEPTEAVKLLNRSDDEIAQVVNEWIAGTNDDLESLQKLLLQDQEWWSDADVTVDESADAVGRAIEIIEDTICRMKPTPLSLRRIRSWCLSYTLPASYEAVLTRFAALMSEEEVLEYQRAARSLFRAEVVDEWCGISSMK